jgi:protein pelota
MQFKKEKAFLLITPEDEEDLFNLAKIIEKGDVIEGKDSRKVKIGNEVVKKNYFISLKVEEVKLGNPLRVKGIILNEHEDFPKGAYHSFTITPFKTIKLVKKHYPSYIFDLLEKKRKQPVKVLLIDDEKAEFYEIMDKSVKLLNSLKYKEKDNEERALFNYKKVIKEIKEKNWENFIIGGPGVFKEELLKELKKEGFEGKVYLANVSHLGKAGIKELLKREELKTLLKDFKIKEEEELINKFMEELKKEGNVAYGKEGIKKAIEYGAIELLVLEDDLVFKNKNEEIEEIIKRVEEMNGKIKLIETEEKKRLKGFGGMVAFLRFKI